jgi:hypothetical protein
MVRKVIGFLVFIFVSIFSFSQAFEYPYQIPEYNFIHYNKNKIEFFGDSNHFENFFYKYDSINFYGTGKINIVHLGGSHIQADIYTHRLRRRMQTFMPGANGGRDSYFRIELLEPIILGIIVFNLPANGTIVKTHNVKNNVRLD